jgi:hypothetical protein
MTRHLSAKSIYINDEAPCIKLHLAIRVPWQLPGNVVRRLVDQNQTRHKTLAELEGLGMCSKDLLKATKRAADQPGTDNISTLLLPDQTDSQAWQTALVSSSPGIGHTNAEIRETHRMADLIGGCAAPNTFSNSELQVKDYGISTGIARYSSEASRPNADLNKQKTCATRELKVYPRNRPLYTAKNAYWLVFPTSCMDAYICPSSALCWRGTLKNQKKTREKKRE